MSARLAGWRPVISAAGVAGNRRSWRRINAINGSQYSLAEKAFCQLISKTIGQWHWHQVEKRAGR